MKCKGCEAEVRNIAGKRHTIEKLTEIHRASCPAKMRGDAKK